MGSARTRLCARMRPHARMRLRARVCPHTNAPGNSPKNIHPSPLLGGRLGGGWDVASDYQRSFAPRSPTLRLDRRAAHLIHCHSGAFLSSFLRRQEWGRLRFFPSFLRRQEWREAGRCSEQGLVRGSLPPTPHLTSPPKRGEG